MGAPDTMTPDSAPVGSGELPDPDRGGEARDGSGQLELTSDVGGAPEDSGSSAGWHRAGAVDAAPAPFTVIAFGTPAPQGSKSAFYNRKTGRVNQVESSKALKPWRDTVIAATRTEIDARPHFTAFDGPLVAHVVFTMRKPTTAPKTRRTYPDRVPDLDKLARAVCDALTQAGAIADDARIVEFLRLAKVFPNEDPDALPTPGVRIAIRQIITRR